MRVGVLHPGEMGVTVLESLMANGASATWVKEGRSESTIQRASSVPSLDTLEELTDSVETIISVCPPSAALEVALNIFDKGFKGIYVDANAISPLESRKISELFGAAFVDGGIIGPPAKEAGTTRRRSIKSTSLLRTRISGSVSKIVEAMHLVISGDVDYNA